MNDAELLRKAAALIANAHDVAAEDRPCCWCRDAARWLRAYAKRPRLPRAYIKGPKGRRVYDDDPAAAALSGEQLLAFLRGVGR